VYVDLKGDGKLDPGDPTATTDTNGNFTITGLAPGGPYAIRLVSFPGEVTIPVTVTLTGGQAASVGIVPFQSASSILPLSFDASPFGTQNPDVQTAEVNGLYNLILNRAPDAPGGVAAVAYLKGGGSVAQLAANLLGSAEYLTGVVASYYLGFLGRAGSTAEIASWVAAMQAGLTEEQVAADFFESAEFSQEHASDADFVQALYNDILGREGAAPEISGWTSSLAAGVSRAAVIGFILGSTESEARSVAAFYVTFPGVAPDPEGLSFWVTGLQYGATLTAVAADFAGSAQFASRANATVG
jgi:hypothetical protein